MIKYGYFSKISQDKVHEQMNKDLVCELCLENLYEKFIALIQGLFSMLAILHHYNGSHITLSSITKDIAVNRIGNTETSIMFLELFEK